MLEPPQYIKNFHLKMSIFTAVKYCCILHGRVCVMSMQFYEESHYQQLNQKNSALNMQLTYKLCTALCTFYISCTSLKFSTIIYYHFMSLFYFGI